MSKSVREAQKIGRLTPLKDVLARIADEISPVTGRDVALADAAGRVLAADVVIGEPYPAKAIALRDGFAVRAEDTEDASSYAPAPLRNARAVEVGDAVPESADAVVPLDGVMNDSGGVAVIVPVAAGDGVLAAGADISAGVPALRESRKLLQANLAVLRLLGIKTLSVRVPRVRIYAVKSLDAIAEAITGLAEAIIVAAGGERIMNSDSSDLRQALSAEANFIIVVGGSGVGERDASIATLQDVGHLHFHGIGIAPGETSAFGLIGNTAVLVVPGRIDAAFAVLVTLGDAIMARLAGHRGEALAATAVLSRKVVSTIGLVEIVPVQLQDGKALPLASGYLPMQVILKADGYIVVPADSEGYPAGTIVTVRAMP